MNISERPDPLAEPLAVFQSMYRTYCRWLTLDEGPFDPVGAVTKEAFDSFERSVEHDSENMATVACHGGCASCCTIRVAATAPEILLIARYIRSSPKTMEFELERRILKANDVTMLLGEAQRMESGVACPFIDHDLCVIYSVRPLACRGHASYDTQACIDALAGHPCEIPVSVLHMTARSLIQNAMQAALRDHGYAWATYELNQALQIALADEASETAWMNGDDVFAPALISDVSSEEMAATFDAIKAYSA